MTEARVALTERATPGEAAGEGTAVDGKLAREALNEAGGGAEGELPVEAACNAFGAMAAADAEFAGTAVEAGAERTGVATGDEAGHELVATQTVSAIAIRASW
jgi:hypothetical protein